MLVLNWKHKWNLIWNLGPLKFMDKLGQLVSLSVKNVNVRVISQVKNHIAVGYAI